MLEALQDIEIASKLVGFDSDNDESLDDKYKKLHCNITSLAHDSEDYKLVERYLFNTHAPTHKVRCYFSSVSRKYFPHRIYSIFSLSPLPKFLIMYVYVYLFIYKNEGLVAGTGGSFCT